MVDFEITVEAEGDETVCTERSADTLRCWQPRSRSDRAEASP
jgi:hypothetical protein